MNQLHRLAALSDEFIWFFKGALLGKIHESELSDAQAFGSQQNPVSRGLTDGYSAQDIAHFYIVRELGGDWIEQILDNLYEEFLGRLAAYKEFGEDVMFENKFAVENMRKGVGVNDQFV